MRKYARRAYLTTGLSRLTKAAHELAKCKYTRTHTHGSNHESPSQGFAPSAMSICRDSHEPGVGLTSELAAPLTIPDRDAQSGGGGAEEGRLVLQDHKPPGGKAVARHDKSGVHEGAAGLPTA